MVVHVGTKFYGKVDRVPNLFYVRTQFFHVQFLPLIPLGSYLLVEGTNDERGVKIPLSIKSVFTAWVRAALVLIAVGYGILTAVHVVPLLGNQQASVARVLQYAGWMAGACLVYWITVRFSRPSYNRAIKLGGYLGLEPAVVEKYLYDNLPAAEVDLPAAEEGIQADEEGAQADEEGMQAAEQPPEPQETPEASEDRL